MIIFTNLTKGILKLPVFITLLFVVVQLSAQNDCASATVISSVPFSSGAQTTCGTVNDYIAGSYCTSSNYGDGEDYVYSINIASAPVTYNFALGGSATWKIMSVHAACPPTTGNCIGGLTTSSGSSASGSITFPSAGTYYIYIDTWPTPTCGGFTLDITLPPPPPANDDCGAATSLTVYNSTTCGGTTAGTTINATQSIAAGTCLGTADDDVWYSFVATEVSHIITVVGSASLDAVVEGRSGACNGTQIGCADATASGGTEALTLTGLTIGNTYLVRIYGYGIGSSSQGTFTVCVTTPASMAVTAVATTQPASTATQGAINVQILRFQVTTAGGLNPLSVTSINLDAATGTTNLADITNLKVYYTTTTTFSTTTQFGSTLPAPSATPTVTGSQTLAVGSGNYFWIVYDISCSATPINTIDCSLTSFVAGGTPNIPGTPNPGTAIAISALFAPTYVSVGNASVAAGSANNQIVRANISGSSLCPSSVTSVRFNTSTSTAPSTDISSAKCYYTTTTTFSTTTPFGSAVAAPSGDITFTGSQLLANGTGNYFWLVYDISCGALPPNVINGTVVDLMVGANTIAVTGTTPTAKTITALTSYDTKADGNWNDPNTWFCAVPPVGTSVPVNINHNVTLNTDATINASVTIAAGKTLIVNANMLNVGTATGAATQTLTVNGTLNASGGTINVGTAAAVATSNLTVASGGSLLLSNGAINLGPTGGFNRSYTNGGTMTVSGGTFTINGRATFSSGSTFNQSSGSIIIDGNSGASGTSVASGTALLLINSALGSVTGGELVFTDPNFNASGKALDYNVSTTPMSWSAAHVTRFGDGISAQASSNTGGFIVECYTSTGRLFMGSVDVKGGNTTNRWTSLGAWSMNTAGTLTVDADSEIRLNSSSISPVIAGNLVNNGIITSTVTVVFATLSGNAVIAGTTPQTVSGNGVFRNLVTSPTANWTSITVNNSGGITFSGASSLTGTGTGSISGTLTLTSGKIFNSSPLTLGTTTSSFGTLSGGGTTAYITGEFRRWNGATTGTTARIFPIGSTASYQPVNINFTVAQTTAGVISALFTNMNPGTGGLPLLDGGITCTSVSPSGYWTVDRISGGGGTYTADVNASGFTKNDGTSPITQFSDIRLLKRANGGSWVNTDGTPTAPASLASVTRPGCTGFSQFGVGGTEVALPLELKSFTGKVLDHSNLLEWTTASEKNVAWHIIERSPNGFDGWEETGRKVSYGDALINQFYTLEDRTPLVKSFYRLRSEDRDGREQVSDVIVLVRENDQLGIIAVFPNPVTDLLQVRFNAEGESVATVRVTDFTGRLIREQKTDTQKGVNDLSVDTGQLGTGTYFIQILVGEAVSAPVRFVRQ